MRAPLGVAEGRFVMRMGSIASIPGIRVGHYTDTAAAIGLCGIPSAREWLEAA